jgi:hypothetical protein
MPQQRQRLVGWPECSVVERNITFPCLGLLWANIERDVHELHITGAVKRFKLDESRTVAPTMYGAIATPRPKTSGHSTYPAPWKQSLFGAGSASRPTQVRRHSLETARADLRREHLTRRRGAK